jgi:hypothetical protein
MSKLKDYALRHFATTLILVIVLGAAMIALLVHYKFAFLNFFFLPVILAGYYLGKKQAVLTAGFCVLLVALYDLFFIAVFRRQAPPSLDDVFGLVTWAGFLILTAAVMGAIADEREAKLKNTQRAYVGMLEIMLRYLEVADEKKPRSVRLALLAGRIAEALGLPTFQAENIRSAALLLETGDLRSNISLYGNLSTFMATGGRPVEDSLSDRDQVLLKTTALLLKDIEPILANYFYHYVEEANILNKDLSTVPIASSVLALADLYDRLASGGPLGHWREHVKSVQDIGKLSGRAFPALAVRALFQVIPPQA